LNFKRDTEAEVDTFEESTIYGVFSIILHFFNGRTAFPNIDRFISQELLAWQLLLK